MTLACPAADSRSTTGAETVVEVEYVHLTVAGHQLCDAKRGVAAVDADLGVAAAVGGGEELDCAQVWSGTFRSPVGNA